MHNNSFCREAANTLEALPIYVPCNERWSSCSQTQGHSRSSNRHIQRQKTQGTVPRVPEEFNHLLLHKVMVKWHRYLACYFLPMWERGQCSLSQEMCILKAYHKPHPLSTRFWNCGFNSIAHNKKAPSPKFCPLLQLFLLWISKLETLLFWVSPFYSVVALGLMHWKNKNASILKRDNNVLPSCLQDNGL